MSRVRLFGPDGDEIEIRREIGFLGSRVIQRVMQAETEELADCLATDNINVEESEPFELC